MKKLFFIAALTVAYLAANAAGISNWEPSTKTSWAPSEKTSSSSPSLRASGSTFNESFYDSIPLPYMVTNATFDTLVNAVIDTVPNWGGSTYPMIGYKFTLTEKTPVSTIFSSDSIYQYAFQISDTVDMSNTLYQSYSGGTTDSLDAGVYYMILITNYQLGTFNLKVVDDTIETTIPTFKEVTLPLDSISVKFSVENTSFINVEGDGVYPAVGIKIKVDKDTILSAYFESKNIYEYAFLVSETLPTGYSSSDFMNSIDTLKAGKYYYFTFLTNNQYGTYNLFLREGEFDTLQFTPITLPYGVINAGSETGADIVEFDGDVMRARGYEFTIAEDTVVIFSDSIYGVSDYDIELFDSNMSSIKYLDMNDTTSLTAGTYYVVIYSDEYSFHYNFSAKQKGETVIASAKDVVSSEFKVYSDKNGIVISGLSSNESVMVVGIDGNIISKFVATSDIETIPVPVPGIYIVNIDGVSKKLFVK